MLSEGKQPSLFVPLRVRFRPPGEPPSEGPQREETSMATAEDEPTAPSLPAIKSTTLQQNRQIKELIRLGNILRAELKFDEVLEQVISSINSCLGFRASVLNMIESGGEYLKAVAFFGISEEDKQTLQAHPVRVSQMLRMMQAQFQISQSYFISHKYIHLFNDVTMVGGEEVENHHPGDWHPMDLLIVPLFSPRQAKLLGFISLDDPVNNQVPTEESIEMIELFANQAALAIDNALFFQEQEIERAALERAILDLRRDMERVQRGDLRVRMQFSHEKLRPVVEAINLMIGEMSSLLGTVQMVTQAVDEHTQDVRHRSDLLAGYTNHQESQVGQISLAIKEIKNNMERVSVSASTIANVSKEAINVSVVGQEQIALANEGMNQMRELTVQSSRVMKRLSESGQEINDTVAEISDLTTHMNLLALNAAIEAVRAGDQGQGFVVIAQEIRSLAVHSAEAARKVSTRLRTIQHETSTVSESVQKNVQQVVTQSNLVDEAAASLDAINVVTTQMSNLVQDICNATISQSQGSQLVDYSVKEISRVTSEINEHMLDMQHSVAHLVDLTNFLRTRMSVFRIPDEE